MNGPAAPAAPAAPRARLGVIFLTVLIDLIGFGLVIPILPYYAEHFGARGLGFGSLIGAYALMQFLGTAVLGRLSDRWGRRPLLLTTMLLNAAGYVAFAFAGSYELLFVSRLVSGFAGGNLSVAYAYVADITTTERRSRGMGLIGAAFGVGFIVGPALGGVTAHFWGDAAPGFVAAGLSLANLGLAWRILAESLHEHHRSRRPLFAFGDVGRVFARRELRWLMLAWLAAPIAFAGYTVAMPLYVGDRFGWGELQLSELFVVIGLVAALVQGWAFGVLTRRTGDRPLLIAGTFGMALGIAAVPFTHSVALLYGWTVVLAFANSLFVPAANGMTSVLASPTEQGTILGVAQALAAFGRFSGPVGAGELYDHGGAVLAFGAATAIMVLGGFAALKVPGEQAREDRGNDAEEGGRGKALANEAREGREREDAREGRAGDDTREGARESLAPQAPPLVKRHHGIVRLTHWVNAVVLFGMIASGLQIYGAYPRFGLRGAPLPAPNPFDGRGFPQWARLGGWLAGGLNWHFFLMWPLFLNGLLYAGYLLVSGEIRTLAFRPRDVPRAVRMQLYYVRLLREHPPQGKHNALQKAAYSFIVVWGALSVASGLAVWKPIQLPWLVDAFGGYEWARYWHFVAVWVFAAFTIVHVLLVLLVDPASLRAMITGWYRGRFPSEGA